MKRTYIYPDKPRMNASQDELCKFYREKFAVGYPYLVEIEKMFKVLGVKRRFF